MTPVNSTRDLIARLAEAPPPPPLQPGRTALTVIAAVLMGLCAFLLIFGLRADLGLALAQPVIVTKSILPLALGGLALPLALRSMRPGLALPIWPLAGIGALAVVLFCVAALAAPPGRLLPDLLGQTALACLVSVTLLSTAPIGIGIALMRRGAPTRPARAGALIGLAAGGLAAAGYALHCTEDSPLFFVTWYGLAILLCTGMGAALGARFLRW